MGNRAGRRAWLARINADPRSSELHKRLALAIAEMDKRGFVLCEREEDYYFEPKDQYAAAKTARLAA